MENDPGGKKHMDLAGGGERSGKPVTYGFLHVGKTGGTSLVGLIKKARTKGYPVPEVFGHGFTLRDVLRDNPRVKLSVTIRDPIERMVSGFNSRRKQGRPTYNSIWTAEEAVAFLWFPDVVSFVAARLSNDERLLSAALFAEKAISHLRRGYAHHFHSAEFVQEKRDAFYFVGEIGNLQAFAYRYLAPSGVPREFCDEAMGISHSAGDETQADLARLSKEDMARMRSIYAAEYEIYEALRQIALVHASP